MPFTTQSFAYEFLKKDKSNFVKISEGHLTEPMLIDRESVEEAIENVKAERKFYASEQTYKIQLIMYEGALRCFEENE